MAVPTANRALVVDDDPMLCGVITRLMTERGYEVCGDADSPDQAMAELERTDARVVVLDLALRGGHGEHLLRRIRDERPSTRVIIFSSYVGESTKLLESGAAAVVEKPDFAQLEEVLDELLTLPDEQSSTNRRREPPRPIPESGPPARSLSGFEPWQSFHAAAAHLRHGDAVLALDVLPAPSLREHWDDVFRTDYRVAIGRAAASVRRDQDRVSISPLGIPVMLIIAGHPEAPGSVFDRIDQRWHREIGTCQPIGAFAHVSASRSDVLDRCLTLVTDPTTTVAQPLRMA